MSNLFDMNDKQGTQEGEGENTGNGINMENMPNADDIHQHINSMMGGKLGKLAMELAEETANDLNIDMENTTDAKDVFQKLFKNPGKMMNMVKNIGNKIDEKIKSGEIKESELMSEGMDLLNKMQSMPGMGDMQKMFSQMGIPGLGKGGKLNMGAMEAMLNKNMKAAKMKERMQAKVASKNTSTASVKETDTNTVKTVISDDEIIKIFSTGEKVEKTPRGAKPPQQQKTNSSKGKKKK
jgi:urease gamma subunit